jgi:hypothetical protein
MEFHLSSLIRSGRAIFVARAKLVLYVGVAIAVAAFGQQNANTVNPDASALQANASDLHNQSPAMHDDLVQQLRGTGPLAAQKNLKTNGLSFHIYSDGPLSTPAGLLSVLQRDTCSSDIIVTGQVSGQKSHLTTNRRNVYTDYLFNVNQTLRGLPSAQLVLTRRGGSVQGIASGSSLTSVDVTDDEYPNLQPIKVYLLILARIAASGAYATMAAQDVLVEDNGQWKFVRVADSQIVLPELAQGKLEGNISSWLQSCR